MIIALLTIGAIAALGSAIFDAVVLYWHRQDRLNHRNDIERIRNDEAAIGRLSQMVRDLPEYSHTGDNSEYLLRTSIQEAINRRD
jgi:hypothetical protein